MTKTEILQELQLLTDLASTTNDTWSYNKLSRVKDSLESLWQTEYAYFEEIKQVLNYDETMDNLNQLNIR
jgi:hypothetical protein